MAGTLGRGRAARAQPARRRRGGVPAGDELPDDLGVEGGAPVPDPVDGDEESRDVGDPVLDDDGFLQFAAVASAAYRLTRG